MVWVSVSPMWVQLSPPSVLFQIPAPAWELRKMLASPVPIQTMSWSEGARARSPMEVVTWSSKTGVQVTPSLSVLHTPPEAPPTYIVYVRPLGSATATSVIRPPKFTGPRNCQGSVPKRERSFMASWVGNAASRWVAVMGRLCPRATSGVADPAATSKATAVSVGSLFTCMGVCLPEGSAPVEREAPQGGEEAGVSPDGVTRGR
jgi:hypothetical protein